MRIVGWLEGDSSDRVRFADMHARFSNNGWLLGVLIGGTTILAAASYGWWLVALPVFASAVMAGAKFLYPRTNRPEVLGMLTFVLLELDLAVTVLFTGGGGSPLLSLMLVPIVSQAVAFRPRVTIAWVGLAAVLAVSVIGGATRLGADTAPASPFLQAVGYLALLGCLAISAHDLASAEVDSRDQAVLDDLTGLFNRKALQRHFIDLRAQAKLTGDPFAMVMVDIDHFKTINDSHGHHRGDIVLQQLADRLRGNLRSGDLVYRMGGEEFLILMPGHDQAEAGRAAERLRKAIAGDHLAGLAVTVSAGLTSAGGGQDCEYGAMLKAADEALYRAKANGRNQICVSPERGPGPGSTKDQTDGREPGQVIESPDAARQTLSHPGASGAAIRHDGTRVASRAMPLPSSP